MADNMNLEIMEDPMKVVLGYCGLEPAHVEAIMADDLESFAEVGDLDDKDITKSATAFAARTIANGNIVFGMRRTNALMALVHWVQDFGRISRTPSVARFPNRASFMGSIKFIR